MQPYSCIYKLYGMHVNITWIDAYVTSLNACKCKLNVLKLKMCAITLDLDLYWMHVNAITLTQIQMFGMHVNATWIDAYAALLNACKWKLVGCIELYRMHFCIFCYLK